jgi:hypothetical protein
MGKEVPRARQNRTRGRFYDYYAPSGSLLVTKPAERYEVTLTRIHRPRPTMQANHTMATRTV